MVASAAVAREGWCVYMLRCRDGSLYTGITNDVERRLAAHSAGKGGAYTRSRCPLRLVYREGARDRGAALRREAALKRLTRLEKWMLVRSLRWASRRRRPSRPASSPATPWRR